MGLFFQLSSDSYKFTSSVFKHLRQFVPTPVANLFLCSSCSFVCDRTCKTIPWLCWFVFLVYFDNGVELLPICTPLSLPFHFLEIFWQLLQHSNYPLKVLIRRRNPKVHVSLDLKSCKICTDLLINSHLDLKSSSSLLFLNCLSLLYS